MCNATDRYRLLHELTPGQALALEALDGAATHVEAAEIAGVDRTTVSRWASKHPEFRAELNRRKADRAQRNMERLRTLTESAVDAVEEAIEGGDLGAALQWIKLRGLECLTETPTGATVAKREIDRHRLAMRTENEEALLSHMGQRTTIESMDDVASALEDAGQPPTPPEDI